MARSKAITPPRSQTISEQLSLNTLRDRFGLVFTEDPAFFPEWRETLPELTANERSLADRLRHRYRYYLEEGLLLEESVKMMLISPLLEAVGLFDLPWRSRFEAPVELRVQVTEETPAQDPQIYRGRMDTLVVQNQFWLLVIESKQMSFSVENGLAQILAYMLANPHPPRPVFGLVSNGHDFLFLKLLQRDGLWQYGQSAKLATGQVGDLERTIAILKQLQRVLSV